MTESRKLFLEKISGEQRTIRYLIRRTEWQIHYYKFAINTTYKYDELTKKEYLELIRYKKFILKSLKKQLYSRGYCCVCGQKLR